jgi:hypothetical protein
MRNERYVMALDQMIEEPALSDRCREMRFSSSGLSPAIWTLGRLQISLERDDMPLSEKSLVVHMD